MNEKQIKTKIMNIYKNKQITERQYKNTINYIEMFKDTDSFFYNFNMGKFLTMFGDYNEAINYLEKALEIDDTKASIYYNLYKCYVRKGKIEKAYLNLSKCMSSEKHNVNFDFPLSVMNVIMDIDNNFNNSRRSYYAVCNSDVLGYNKLDDEILKELYNNLIDVFNDKNYFKCCDILSVMNTRINEISYPMEVDTLKILCNILKQKISCNYAALIRNEKLNMISDREFVDIVLQMNSLGYMEDDSVLKKIENLFDKNYSKAKMLLDKVSNDDSFNEYKDIIKYLEGVAREKESLFSLDEVTCSEFFSIKKRASFLTDQRRYNEALSAYYKAKAMTDLPICDYYIGKILYKKGKVEQAKDYFLNYLEYGGTKTEKALMYLGNIAKIQKDNTLAKKYIREMQKMHEFFDRNFKYIPDYKKKKMSEEETFDANDILKQRNMRNVRMQPWEFEQGYEDVKPEEFYNVPIDGKLTIIKHLYQSGSFDVANKLFEEVQKECDSKDKTKINQFVKNKKIYMNQRRTSS